MRSVGCVHQLCDSQRRKTIGVFNSRLLEDFVEFTIEASIESAPLRSVGRVQPEERNIGCVLNSRLHCATRMGIPRSGSKPTGAIKAKSPLFRVGFAFIGSLAVCYSRMASATLPSSQLRFTSEFGMESGGSTALLPPGKNL